ncbi:hypothetical protein K438DRAFT_2018565 [Mycena galopus ATCC 62051]|nr:hypothetical protein K438DRAFT_2018565 [Mycena galopus ATCC 62051]
MPAVHSFQHPRLIVHLSLGHKHPNQWFLLFAQPYPTAPSREISRLDTPGPFKTRADVQWSTRPRFWFDPRARSGWEQSDARPGQAGSEETLLDLLMNLDIHEPPLFAIVDHEPSAGMSKVEVLVPEHLLAHYCEGCGRWEVAGDTALRWFMVRSDSGSLPGYLCPSVALCSPLAPLPSSGIQSATQRIISSRLYGTGTSRRLCTLPTIGHNATASDTRIT